MRMVSAWNTRAVRSLGRGGDLVSGSAACTSTVTFAAVLLPSGSATSNLACTRMGVSGAW